MAKQAFFRNGRENERNRKDVRGNDARDEEYGRKNIVDDDQTQGLRNAGDKEETKLPILLNKGKRVRKTPWKIVVHNVQSLVSENSKMKVDYYKEYTQENKVLLLNFTETWLNKNVKDDAEIEGYTIFRGDRQENITQGGNAIYVMIE